MENTVLLRCFSYQGGDVCGHVDAVLMEGVTGKGLGGARAGVVGIMEEVRKWKAGLLRRI